MINMKLANVIVTFLIIIVVLTLIGIEPYHTGHLIMPSPIDLEVAVVIIIVSVFIIIITLLPKRNYTPI